MSANFPQEICVKPAELYLLIQFDRILWKLCDILESAWPELAKHPAEKLKAVGNVWFGLLTGSTRAEMIKGLTELGYEESYAEKLVDKMTKKWRELLGRSGVFRIGAEPEPVKGQFGKPYSRRRRPGRPPAKYKLIELPKAKPNKRMEELTCLVTLLSGSSERFIKLICRMILEESEIREALLALAGKIFPMTPEELKKAFNEAMGDGKDLEKHIDDWYNKVLEPVWKEIPHILGLNDEEVT